MPAERTIVDDQSKRRLERAVQSVENRSAAEIVVSLEPKSGHYGGVDAAVGALAGWLCLLYTLFAPQIFGLVWIALMVPTAFGAGFGLSRLTPAIRRTLAARHLDAWARAAAHDAFVSLKVSATRHRSGVLVYVSALEQRAVVVADVGIQTIVPSEIWREIVTAIETSVAGRGLSTEGVDALARAIQAAAEPLEQWLPRPDDDVDELANLVMEA